MTSASAPASPSPWWVRSLQLFGLCGFAVAQPVLELLGRNPTFFVAHRARSGDVALLVLACVLPIPAALIAMESLLQRLAPRAVVPTHAAIVAGLVAAILVPLIDRGEPLPALAVPVVALCLGTVAFWLYRRVASVRSFVTILGPAPFAFVLLFVTVSPAGVAAFADRAAATSSGGARPVSVFFLVLDQLPLGHLMNAEGEIAAERFPNFSRLAATSTWYRNATTVFPYTEKSVPAILSGRFPPRDAAPTLDHYPQNLFTVLAPSHELRVQEKVTDLCPPTACERPAPRAGEGLKALLVDSSFAYLHVALPEAWRRGLPPVDDKWAGFTTPPAPSTAETGTCNPDPEGVKSSFANWLDAAWSNEPPTLHFLHVLLPHRPWRHLPSGHVYDEGEMHGFAYRSSVWGEHTGLVNRALQQQMLQLAYTDALIGRLLDHLEAEGLLDTSAIVVTSDHGMAFTPGEHVRRLDASTTDDVFEEVARVPLFFKAPHQTGGAVVDANVETIDILPTLADVLHVELSQPVDGQSVIDPTFVPRDRKRAAGQLTDISWPPELDQDFPIGAKIDGLFGRGTGQSGLYALGPNRDLVGRDVADLAVDLGARLRSGKLEQPALHAGMDPTSPCIAARVDGLIKSAASGELAVAVNGRIAGIGPTFPSSDSAASRFTVLVRPDMFRSGADDVRLFVVVGTGERRRLEPISIDQ